MPSPAANAGIRNSPRPQQRRGPVGPPLRARLASTRPSATSPASPAASSSQIQAGQPSWRPSSSG